MGSSLIGRLLLYDAESMSMQSLQFGPLDSKPDITDLSHAQALFNDPTYCTPRPQQVQEDEAAGESMMQSITVPELISKQQTGWNPFIIDVRSDEELQQVRLATFDLHVVHDVANMPRTIFPATVMLLSCVEAVCALKWPFCCSTKRALIPVACTTSPVVSWHGVK